MNECGRKLRIFRREKQIYCGEGKLMASRVTRAPNIPQANSVTISEKSFNQFKAHIKSKVAAFKSSRNCNYYKDMVEYWEKRCDK